MKELFNITTHITGDGFRMQLSTGVIDVPDDNGGYIISSGCGSGKTESIKSLIRQKYNSGILYCVDTRDELGKMYDWILANLVNRELGYGDILRESDVMIISSDKERSSFLNQYRDNPEILMDKKIILITHVRFWTDLINYFLIYRPKSPVDSFDGDFRKLMIRPDLRRYILFDETPTFIRPFVEFDKTILGVFSKTDDTGNIICMSPEEIEIYYDHFIRNTRNDLFNQSYRINRIKRDVVLNLIPQYYDSWMLSESDKAGITFYPVDLCPPGVYINTHVLIFEGDIVSHLNFKKLPALNNLPTDEIQKVYQDKDGFIWLASRYGFYQYDGYEATLYKSNLYAPGLLTNNNILCLVDDYKHNLWIGTQEGLNILNKKTGEIRKILAPEIPNNVVSCLLVTRDHSVWLGTDSGLCKYIAEKDSFVVYHREQTDGVLDYTAIKSLFEDSEGDLWIGTWSSGLYRYVPSTGKFYAYPQLNERNSNFISLSFL